MLSDPPADMLEAEARRALDRGLAPGFPQKVAANALGIADREREMGPGLAKAERSRLAVLIGPHAELATGNAALCTAIARGDLRQDDPRLLDHLIRNAIAALSVDQPGYPAFKAWLNDT